MAKNLEGNIRKIIYRVTESQQAREMNYKTSTAFIPPTHVGKDGYGWCWDSVKKMWDDEEIPLGDKITNMGKVVKAILFRIDSEGWYCYEFNMEKEEDGDILKRCTWVNNVQLDADDKIPEPFRWIFEPFKGADAEDYVWAVICSTCRWATRFEQGGILPPKPYRGWIDKILFRSEGAVVYADVPGIESLQTDLKMSEKVRAISGLFSNELIGDRDAK